MPSSKNYVRNYGDEYQRYHKKKKQRENRVKRVLARREMESKGRVSKGDGKDVTHRDGNPKNNSPSNLGVSSKSSNRSYARTKKARKKNKGD